MFYDPAPANITREARDSSPGAARSRAGRRQFVTSTQTEEENTMRAFVAGASDAIGTRADRHLQVT